MKKSTLNRLIVLAVAVCVLVGVSPLLKTITGLADVNANFIARINNNAQQSGDTFAEVITKSLATNITSITMIAGEVSQTEFQYLMNNGLHTSLTDLTTNTPPYTIDPNFFEGFPAERKLFVPKDYLDGYKIVDDGDTTDNFWYGWIIMEATPPALVPASSVQDIQNTLLINMVAPAEGETPTTTLDVGTGYTSAITWKNREASHTDVFAPNTIYSAEVTLTSVEGFKFAPNASVSVDTGTVTSMLAVTGDASGNTLSFVVTFPNTTASNLAPPPTNDGILPPAPEPTTPENPTPETPTPEAPTPEAPTPEAPTPENPTPENPTPEPPATEPPATDEPTAPWKPTIMGGFRDTPRASTGGIPMPMAAGDPVVEIKYNITNSPASSDKVEIGGVLTLDAAVPIVREIANGTPSTATLVGADESEYYDPNQADADPNIVRSWRTHTTTRVIPSYTYLWSEEGLASSDSKYTLKDADLLSSTIRLNAFTKFHLGQHTYKVIATETSKMVVTTVKTFYDDANGTKISSTFPPTTAEGSEVPIDPAMNPKTITKTVIFEVIKIPTKIDPLICTQISNKTAQMVATVTGLKAGILFRENTINPDANTRFGGVAFNPGEAGERIQKETTSETATQCVFTQVWDPSFEKTYSTKAQYLGDDNYAPSPAVTKDYNHKLNPIAIRTQDIGVITIDPPIAGKEITKNDSIKKPANASPGYAIDLKWYLGDSLVTEKFYYGQSHKAIVTITSLDGVADTNGEIQSFTIAPNTIASFIALGATIYPTTPMPAYPNLPSVIGGNDRGVGNYIQYTIIFPRTLTEEVKSQETFAFNPFAVPTSKVYGDTDFILQAYGGEGSGSVTYTSDQPNVLRVTTDPYGRAVIKVMGSGTAIITATKAASFVGNDGVWYGLAEAKTTPIVVAPKMLTASVDDKTIKVGSRTTAFNVRVRGFVNGDTADNLVGYAPPIASADVEDIPILGTYDIIVSGGKADPKYVFKYVHGILTVNETGVAPTTNNTSNTVVAGGNSAYIHEPRNDVTITRKDAQYFETGVNMSVEKQTSTISVAESDIVNRNVNAALPGKSTADIYNVSLSLDNEGYALNTEVSTQLKITNTIKNNYTDLGVVHIDAAGNIRSIPSSITSNGEYITFSTNYVGKFAIVGKLRVASADTGGTTTPPPTTTYNPQTGDSTPTFPFIAAILLGCTLLITGSRKGDLI